MKVYVVEEEFIPSKKIALHYKRTNSVYFTRERAWRAIAELVSNVFGKVYESGEDYIIVDTDYGYIEFGIVEREVL